MALKKTGLLGGSFDPVHVAHIALADAACRDAGLDHVELIPVADPWQRAPLSASPAQRLDMLRLAIQGHSKLSVNPVEISRGGKTYTLDTVNELPATAEYYWILGADQLANFCSWHGWRDIARRIHLLVAQRPGAPLAAPALLADHLVACGRQLFELSFPPMPISASEIRRRLATGESVHGLLSPEVERYIEENGLYHAPE
ncbi:MAG TPA: nicotinate (nicotinamide) nucleotide adenylyltransferase [Burkholderiaceae bacterium]|nr:nicotinate (nicotinamide) nucleotide adenylyltransferase [Burkholderiaceae bacterium]